MNRESIQVVVLVADAPSADFLPLSEAEQNRHWQLKVDAAAGTYSFHDEDGSKTQFPIGTGTGAQTGIIGVYDTADATQVQSMWRDAQNAVDAFEFKAKW